MAMVKNNILGLQLGSVPMFRPFVAFAIGICAGYYVRLDVFSFWSFLFIALLGLQLLIYQIRRFGFARILFTLSFYAMWLVLGVWLTVRTMPSYQPLHFSNVTGNSLLIVVDDEPQVKGKTYRFPAVVHSVVRGDEQIRTVGKLMVSIALDSVQDITFGYGDLLHVPNRFQSIKGPSNPREFNYQNYLKNQDIWFQSFILADFVKKVDRGKGHPILAKALFFREEMMNKFLRFIDNPQAFQLAVALIFGYRSEMDERMVNAFTNTGTVHILSVSGLHVAIVFGLLTLILRWMGYFPFGRYSRNVFILGAIWFYVILTGMSPPILRAGIMITFFIISIAVNRQQVTLNTLFASAFFIMLFMPKSLFDIGFQLSYLAVLGILLLHPLLKRLYMPRNRWLIVIVEYIYISVAAQLFTLPIILYHFGQFPTYFIPANLFIALPSTGIMYLGISLALCPFDVINSYIGIVLQALLRFSVYGLEFLEGLPYAVLKGIIWNDIQVFLSLVILFFMIWAWNFRNRKAVFWGMTCLTLFSLLNSVQYIRRSEYSGGRIYNVRSDLAIAQIKNGKVVLHSTFDSLMYSGSRFSVLPDLRQFSSDEQIEYARLPFKGRQNYILSLGGKKILVLENKLVDTLIDVDIIIWRKNNNNILGDIVRRCANIPIFIIDGSNSDKSLEIIQSDKAILEEQMYILKNNFAYVWDEE